MGRKQKKSNSVVTYVCEDFDKVLLEKGETMRDYWFVWSDDFEPIRIAYSGEDISSAMHRIHWAHVEILTPYANDKNRIEAFFIPFSHTPLVRKTRLDVTFYIWTKLVPNSRVEDYDTVGEAIPDYFKTAGKKDRHPPSVDYEGWPILK